MHDQVLVTLIVLNLFIMIIVEEFERNDVSALDGMQPKDLEVRQSTSLSSAIIH